MKGIKQSPCPGMTAETGPEVSPDMSKDAGAPFWQRKALDEMSRAEWESLCDGCAKCCLVKLEDEDTAEILYTDVVCHLLDCEACACTDYKNRSVRVPTCVTLTPDNLKDLDWMPDTCAYKLLRDGKDLPWWHPLVSGERESVHLAGISVRGKVLSEEEVTDDELDGRIVSWPHYDGLSGDDDE
jgi:hypothetical protein